MLFLLFVLCKKWHYSIFIIQNTTETLQEWHVVFRWIWLGRLFLSHATHLKECWFQHSQNSFYLPLANVSSNLGGVQIEIEFFLSIHLKIKWINVLWPTISAEVFLSLPISTISENTPFLFSPFNIHVIWQNNLGAWVKFYVRINPDLKHGRLLKYELVKKLLKQLF